MALLTLKLGSLILAGRDITNAQPGARDMAILFQDNNLFPHLTIAQNVGLGICPALRLTSDETAQVHKALQRVGLTNFGSRKPSELSGGQQSRAALARALVQSKTWMILDEPFAALGPALRAEMLDLVAEVADETNAGIMMVTHAPEDARRIADSVVFVADRCGAWSAGDSWIIRQSAACVESVFGLDGFACFDDAKGGLCGFMPFGHKLIAVNRVVMVGLLVVMWRE